jgi:hypothetical protein
MFDGDEGVEIEVYFASLFARISKVRDVVFEEVESDCANVADCHANVDRWVVRNPHIKALRGWLTWGVDESGTCYFFAHSVVDDGVRLIDITPMGDPSERPTKFLIHDGSEKEFDDMRHRQSMVPYSSLGFLSGDLKAPAVASYDNAVQR